MNGFHCPYESKSVSTSHTRFGGADISIWETIVFMGPEFSPPEARKLRDFH